MSFEVFSDPSTKEALHEEDVETIAGMLKLYELKIMKDLMNSIIEVGAIEVNEKIYDYITEA